ncbi:MAG: ABC transporter substrate binding protein [Oscillospiraceae bacterium]
MKLRGILKRTAAAILAAVAVTSFSGCNNYTAGNGEIVDVEQPESGSTTTTRAYLPCKKEGGGKFRIAYVDIDPYNPTFRMTYYAIESLKDLGWLTYDELPFDPETDSDSLALVNWLADNAQSEYLEFSKDTNFFTIYSTEDEIYQSLKQNIDNGKIDIILCMATSVSQMVESFNFDVPVLMYGIADAVGSGLVASAEDSGNDNYWAHIDSSAFSRQLQYYYDTIPFNNIGIVYENEIVASVDDYRKVAEENNFKMTEYQLKRADYDTDEAYYEQLGRIYDKMISQDKVDAYVITTTLITDVNQAKKLMQKFIDNNIPVFSQIDSVLVQEGAALMIVDPRDATETGPFVANIIGSVLNGSKPRDLEQEYSSKPFLKLNLDVADKINFQPTFEMLIACEEVFCERNNTAEVS